MNYSTKHIMTLPQEKLPKVRTAKARIDSHLESLLDHPTRQAVEG
jgi:hypothetical protein